VSQQGRCYPEEENVKKIEVADTTIRLINAAWIEAVENALAAHGNAVLTEEVMRAAGQKCAIKILDDCREMLGKKPGTVDELLDATNQRRFQIHNLDSLWERRGNKARLQIDDCGCTLVKAGLAGPNPVHCLCSKGLMEKIFSAVCKGPVSVEVVKAIGFGDDVCEFNVSFIE
jgi:predicted hydrocarbon binding protein